MASLQDDPTRIPLGMDAIRELAPDLEPTEAYALAAAMVLEHVGNLFSFLDQRMGELAIFDPGAPVKERVVRESIRVAAQVCALMAKEGAAHGADPAVMRALWDTMVREAIIKGGIKPEE